MWTDRTISCPGATLASSWTNSESCGLAPPRYVNSTLAASHAAVPLFLTFQPTVKSSSGSKLAWLLGDCQINLQSSSLGTVGVGDGEGNRTVGVGDGEGNRTVGVSDSIGSGVADGDVVGISVGSGVVDGLAVGDSVGLAVLEGDGIGVPSGAAIGVDCAEQATRVRARPTKSNALIIVAFAFYSRRIAFSSQVVPGLWAP